MWELVVKEDGQTVHTQEFDTYEEAEAEGQRRCVEIALRGKVGDWTATKKRNGQ